MKGTILRVSVLSSLFMLLLITYTLPWVVNPGAGLSPGGYDLAEWASIHPVSGGESPPLLTALLLRLPLMCATLSFAFFLPPSGSRILAGIVALLMAIALLPPFEFLSDTGNWNHRQQFALAIITLIGGAFGLMGWTRKYRPVVGTATAVIALVACLVGLSRAHSLMQGFNLPTQIGVGGVGTAILFVVLLMNHWQIGRHVIARRPIPTAQAN